MWTKYHVSTFLLTYCSFAIFHVTRKTFGSAKDLLSKEWSPISCNSSYPCPKPNQTWMQHNLFKEYEDSETFLGLLDMLFSIAYGVGLFISGIIGDRVNMRIFYSAGMMLGSAILLVFGSVTEWCSIYNKPLYASLWFIEGLVQSVGWPIVVTVMGNWFNKSSRGLVFGIWSSSASVGNIIGSVLAAAVLDYGYEIAFLCSSCMFFFSSFVIYFGLICSPEEVGLPPVKDVPTEDAQVDTKYTNATTSDIFDIVQHQSNSPKPKKSISFFKALLLPGVIPYALLFAGLKTINYAFFMWLPYYLVNTFNWSDERSSEISSWYDVGGIIGGIFFGMISDKIGLRTPVLLFMVLAMPFAIYGYSISPSSVAINSLLMAVAGLFVNGASNIISSAVTADLGKKSENDLGENTRVLSTVTGIIDGVGTLGVAIGQYIISVIMYKYSWKWVFNFLILVSGISLLLIIPLFIKETKVLKRYCCRERASSQSGEQEPLIS